MRKQKKALRLDVDLKGLAACLFGLSAILGQVACILRIFVK